MKYLIIGDIHGRIDLLEKYSRLFDSMDKVIFVGDYVDRGGHSLQVLKYVTKLENSITLIGNHEWKYYKSFCKGKLMFAPSDINPSYLMEFWDCLLKVMYRHGGKRLRYYKDENIFVSHAPAVLYQSDPTLKSLKETLLYGLKHDYRDENGHRVIVTLEEMFGGAISEKPVIYGHNHLKKFLVRENEYCVDFDAGRAGQLAGLIFENSMLQSAYIDGLEVDPKIVIDN